MDGGEPMDTNQTKEWVEPSCDLSVTRVCFPSLINEVRVEEGAHRENGIVKTSQTLAANREVTAVSTHVVTVVTTNCIDLIVILH